MATIILTVHNKGSLLGKVLESIIQCQKNNSKLIIVLDGCTDNSEMVLQQYKLAISKKFKLHVIYQPNVFETLANNSALRCVDDKYAIIVQDDMIIREYNWTNRITQPFKIFDDVFAVTARCAHSWLVNTKSKYIEDNMKIIPDYPDTWCDLLEHVNHATRYNTSRSTFAVRNSVNRGPLALDMSVVEKFNYFDEAFAPQDMDDHDLCYRITQETNLVCGLYWINYFSDENWGGTRENGKPKQWFLKAQHKNSFIFYNRYKDILNVESLKIDNREII